jgi:hypothetical protein
MLLRTATDLVGGENSADFASTKYSQWLTKLAIRHAYAINNARVLIQLGLHKWSVDRGEIRYTDK